MNNVEKVKAALAALAAEEDNSTPEQPAAVTQQLKVTGALRAFKTKGGSRVLLGDLRVDRVPAGIKWTAGKSSDGATEYLTSSTQWSGVAHIGEHGRAWVTDLADTGAPVVATVTTAAFDFDAMLAAAKVTK